MSRLRSDFWVSAHLRRCGVEGVEAVLRRRGAAEAGAIFCALDRLDGRVSLFGPAPQSLVGPGDLDRLFVPLLADATPLEVANRMASEIRFDPDLWWIAIDDRDGRHFLPLAPDDA